MYSGSNGVILGEKSTKFSTCKFISVLFYFLSDDLNSYGHTPIIDFYKFCFFYSVEVTDHNFSKMLKNNFTGQIEELARRCVQPPLRRKPKYVCTFRTRELDLVN